MTRIRFRPMKIELAHLSGAEEYGALLDGLAIPRYFQGEAWAAAVCDGFPETKIFVVAATEGSGRPVALLPAIEMRKGPFSMRLSMPFGTYGGVFGRADEKMVSRMLALYFSTGPGLTAGEISMVSPPEVPGLDPQPRGSVPRKVEEFTETAFILPLDPDPEQVWQRMSRSNRREIDKSRREGVSVSMADGEEDWRALFSLQQASLARWGERAGYPYRFLRALDRPGSELRIARLDGRHVGALLSFTGAAGVFLWSMPSLQGAWKSKPNYALIWSAVEAACLNGFSYMNIGTSGGKKGVEEFKRKFGAAPVPYTVYRRRGPLYRLARRLAGRS